MKATNENRQDIYTRITATIVAELEKGARPWVKPWNAEHAAGRITRPLRHNGQPYSGINVLSLWASASVQGFAAPIWMTFRQALELGGHVRKGEKGSPVVYANAMTKTETDSATGDEVERSIRFLKGYTVFNICQVEGLPDHFYAPAAPRLNPPMRIERAEKFFAATGASISYGGSRAFYRPSTDSIVMPPIEAFTDAEAFYSTLCHEGIHWSGIEARLARDFGSKRFGSEAYAMEELVAELGSAFLCADLDLSLEPRQDHVDYLANWLTVLKADSRAIFTAASHAQRAADFLNGLQPKPATIAEVGEDNTAADAA